MKLDNLQISSQMNLQNQRDHDQAQVQMDSNQAYNDIEFPNNRDGSSEFTQNTNSQFYMWEAINQRDIADFENDIIASTNEVAYTKALLKEEGHTLFDSPYMNQRVLDDDDSLMIFGENEYCDDDDRELSLDMADFLGDGNPPAMRLATADAEIYEGEREECSNCGEEAEDDLA